MQGIERGGIKHAIAGLRQGAPYIVGQSRFHGEICVVLADRIGACQIAGVLIQGGGNGNQVMRQFIGQLHQLAAQHPSCAWR